MEWGQREEVMNSLSREVSKLMQNARKSGFHRETDQEEMGRWVGRKVDRWVGGRGGRKRETHRLTTVF